MARSYKFDNEDDDMRTPLMTSPTIATMDPNYDESGEQPTRAPDTTTNIDYNTPTNATTNTNNNNEENFFSDERMASKRQARGVGVAAGIVGLVVGGPVLAVAAGFGAAYLAKKNGGKAGEIARQSGTAAANAGDSIRAWDQQHRVSQRTREGITRGISTIKSKFDERNNNNNATRQ